MNNYQSPDKTLWKGRKDGPNALRWHEVINCVDINKVVPSEGIALIGFACDEGIRRNQGRVGAAEGPNAIRSALASLPWFREDLKIYDVGNVICIDQDLEGAQEALAEVIQILLHNKLHPIVLGGGHEVAWGHFQGIRNVYRKAKIGVINFDAHFDMRPLLEGKKGSSGTSFLQIAEQCKREKLQFDYTCIGIQPSGNTKALFNTAEENDVHLISTEELHLNGSEVAVKAVEEVIRRNDKLYVSLCMDVFAAPFAPGVSAPQPLGVFPWHLIPALRALAHSGKVVGFVAAEVSPPLDLEGVTAKLAAQMVAEYSRNLEVSP